MSVVLNNGRSMPIIGRKLRACNFCSALLLKLGKNVFVIVNFKFPKRQRKAKRSATPCSRALCRVREVVQMVVKRRSSPIARV